MLPDKILSFRPNVLTEAQRFSYFEKGYAAIPDYIGATQLDRLRSAMNELVEESRAWRQSDGKFILDEGHTAEVPRLNRVTSPQDHHPAFWDFLAGPEMTELAADVVGPDVKFHHAKLNVKSGKGSRGIKWHQDVGVFPHTDYSPCSIGVYIDGCDMARGPVVFVPGTQNGPLYSMYDPTGAFVIRIQDEELAWVREEMVDAPIGGPGTTILLNCRVVHGSSENTTDRARPLLLACYSSADSFAYTAHPMPSPHAGDIVRGQPAKYASFDPRPVELPPDLRAGYTGAWKPQREEEARKVAAAY